MKKQIPLLVVAAAIFCLIFFLSRKRSDNGSESQQVVSTQTQNVVPVTGTENSQPVNQPNSVEGTPLSGLSSAPATCVCDTPAVFLIRINSLPDELESSFMNSKREDFLSAVQMPSARSDARRNGAGSEPNQTASDQAGFIDEKQLLVRLPISRRTLGNWKSKGLLPYITIGRRCLYDWPSVHDALLRRQRGGQW